MCAVGHADHVTIKRIADQVISRNFSHRVLCQPVRAGSNHCERLVRARPRRDPDALRAEHGIAIGDRCRDAS
jgi:hypothetical protein